MDVEEPITSGSKIEIDYELAAASAIFAAFADWFFFRAAYAKLLGGLCRRL